MDPYRGVLYPTVEDARADGVANPVEVIGRPEDVERIGAAVRSERTREQKAVRNARRKAARRSRRANRGR